MFMNVVIVCNKVRNKVYELFSVRINETKLSFQKFISNQKLLQKSWINERIDMECWFTMNSKIFIPNIDD